MKTKFIFAIFLGLAAAISRQDKTAQIKPPKEVLQEFVKMELEGARLTPEGWRKAAHFLVRPSTAPPHTIDIVSDDFEVHETAVTQGSAKLYVYFSHFHGWLDSALHFEPAPKGIGILREGITANYSLVLTDKHWALEPDGRELKEVAGTPEWRIEGPEVGDISLATAIRYVSEMRDKTTDPTIKKNADQALAKLKHLH